MYSYLLKAKEVLNTNLKPNQILLIKYVLFMSNKKKKQKKKKKEKKRKKVCNTRSKLKYVVISKQHQLNL